MAARRNSTTEAARPTAENKGPAKGAPANKKAKRPADVPEPLPLVGGRLFWAVLLIAAFVVPVQYGSAWLRPLERRPRNLDKWAAGTEQEVTITLVTADFDRLACVADKKVDGMSCAMASDTAPTPVDPKAPVDDNKASVIQPYRTWPGNQLVFVGGLWATPEMAVRLHKEPPAGRDPKDLARFNARCKVKVVERWEKTRLRWGPDQAFHADEGAWVAKAISCEVEGVT